MAAPHISRFLLGFFRLIARVWFRLHFRTVRVSHADRFTQCAETTPLILYGTHCSWWDPMISVLLAAKLMPRRQHFAPMDASALHRQAILKRIGIFGVELNSARGAAQFLRTSLAILGRGGVLWVTPQGRFADVRERPLDFKPGLAALAARVPGGCTLLPLAVEYVFWNQRLPEVLLHFGEPVHLNAEPAAKVEGRLEQALLEAMQELQAKAVARDPGSFSLLRDEAAARRVHPARVPLPRRSRDGTEPAATEERG